MTSPPLQRTLLFPTWIVGGEETPDRPSMSATVQNASVVLKTTAVYGFAVYRSGQRGKQANVSQPREGWKPRRWSIHVRSPKGFADRALRTAPETSVVYADVYNLSPFGCSDHSCFFRPRELGATRRIKQTSRKVGLLLELVATPVARSNLRCRGMQADCSASIGPILSIRKK